MFIGGKEELAEMNRRYFSPKMNSVLSKEKTDKNLI